MIHYLRAAGTSLILDARGAQVPQIVHWGMDLGPLSDAELVAVAGVAIPATAPNGVDVPQRLSLLPSVHDGWTGQPALIITPDPGPFTLRDVSAAERTLVVTCTAGPLMVTTTLELSPEGVLTAHHALHNGGEGTMQLTQAAVVVPLDAATSVEDLDFSGRWALERRPQRRRGAIGTWLRETRHGRGGHDAAFLPMSGTPGFSFRSGEVRAMHVAWSGDTRVWIDRSELGFTSFGGGERLNARTLGPADGYRTPDVVFAWSNAGIDGLSARLHPWVRSWSTIDRARPFTLNTWEAVYFKQSMEKLAPLVEAAAAVGIERFVLDDGWFHGRRDAHRALGDWSVDDTVWPDGLAPLTDLVTSRGMEFGLWFEPEMVNLDSDLARAHPDWVLNATDSPTWRWQYVLDLANPDVAEYLFTQMDARLRESPIRYVKWDHNRDLLVPDAHDQTVAFYGLLDRLRQAHPGVEFESCASGGGRIDLGVLRRVDRVWGSDTNDPLDRTLIHRWTGVLVPPEYLGAHVGDEVAHANARRSHLSMRLAVALLGNAGIESDVTKMSDRDRVALAAFGDEYKRLRSLIHGGVSVNADTADPSVIVRGVVSPERDHAVFTYAVIGPFATTLAEPLRPVGLDPDRIYEVRVLDFGAPARAAQGDPPPWFGQGVQLSGRALRYVGLSMPLMVPATAAVIELRAV